MNPRPARATRVIDYTRLMTDTSRQSEVWLRGAVPGVDPMPMAVAHALLQAKERALEQVRQTPRESLLDVRGSGAQACHLSCWGS